MLVSKPCIVANWKMNGSVDLARAMHEQLSPWAKEIEDHSISVILCPPHPLLSTVAQMFQDLPVHIGAQDCHHEATGAYTGDVSAQMLREAGASAVIIGHSERRTGHAESDDGVASKFRQAIGERLLPIVCVGESAEQRAAQQTAVVVTKQTVKSLPSASTAAPRNWVLAYEPIWAIGRDQTPTEEEIMSVHELLRNAVHDYRERDDDEDLTVLYGGSVNAKNVRSILNLDGVNGVLVGGASLDPSQFSDIVRSVISQ